jgi:hypothetical protein
MATLLRILKHRAVIILLVLLGIAVSLELSAPPTIRLVAIDWLHDHGVADARIGAISINPFTWSLVVHDVKAGPSLQVGRAAINIDLWPLLHHQIYVRDIALDHARLELAQGKKGAWLIAGLAMPAAAPATAEHAKPWYPILHQVKLRDVRIQLSGHDLKLDVPIQSLDINHAFLSQPENQILNTTLRLGPSSFTGLGYRFDGAGLQFHGQLILPGPGASIDDAGTRNVTVKLRDVHLSTAKGDAALTLSQARISDIAVNGPDRIKAGDAEVDDVELRADIPGAAETKVGHVEAQALQYAKGNIDLDTLKVKDIRTKDTSRKVSLGAVADIAMSGLSVSHDLQATLASLKVRGITLPATKEHATGKVGDISVTDARLSHSQSVQASRLDIRGLNLSILHGKHGFVALERLKSIFSQSGPSKSVPSQPRPASKKKTAAGKPAASTAAPALPIVHIEHVTIDKGSKIAFEDDAVEPPVQDELEIETFHFAPLAIGGKQPGTIDAAFRIGDRGSLAIKGELNLDRANPMAKLTINLKRLSMPPLSGYLAKGFGYTIGTGQMDVDSQISIHNQALDAKNKLAIRDLDLKATRQSGKAAQSVGMPLDMAVGMLADSRGDISLDVPVSGRLDNPNVNINDAINQALATAIQSGAMSYASLLLQPYGSILPALSLAKGLLAGASMPRLTPIAFAPRTASLSDEAKAYIGKIALLLKQKSFRLKACGVASQAEVEAEAQGKKSSAEANNKRLLSLADARSTAVIKALAAQGISPDRIFECQPQIDTKAKAQGRVELLLN